MRITEKIGKIATEIITFCCLLCSCSSVENLVENVADFSSNNRGEVWTVVKAPDGDTITAVNSLQSKTIKVRFCGIDAPETSQAMGYQSRNYLRSLLDKSNRQVIIYPIETDRYGRTVAEIFTRVNGVDTFINQSMVESGMAFHYAKYSSNCPNREAIVQAEAIAKSKSIGVWADKNFIKPWDYRRMKRNNN